MEYHLHASTASLIRSVQTCRSDHAAVSHYGRTPGHASLAGLLFFCRSFSVAGVRTCWSKRSPSMCQSSSLYPSLVQHLLGALFKLAAAFVIQLLFVVLCNGCCRRRTVRLVANGARVRVLPRVSAYSLVLCRARAFVLSNFEG